MKDDAKKIQIVLCFLAGIGLFLPLYKISAYKESASLSFMQVFDSAEAVKMGFIDAKIVIGVLVLAFILLLARFKNDNFILKILSLIVILASGILYYINVHNLSAVKVFLSSVIKYGIGYYITLGGYIIALFLGLIDIISNGNNYRRGYPADYDMVVNDNINNNPLNAIQTTNSSNTNPVVNNQIPPESLNNKPNNQVKLSDLVSKNNNNQ